MSSIAVFRNTPPDRHAGTQTERTIVDAEAGHLRRLIESQPSCLLRVGIDGLLLAANEAALQLLGAEELGDVLGRMLTERIIPNHHELWHDFTARVWGSGSGSMECDLVDLGGIHRTVLLKGLALVNHPDGIESMLLALRDTSGNGRLEQALQEHEAARRALDEGQLEHALTEQQRLETLLEERAAAEQRLVAEREAERAQFQALAEDHQLALLLQKREGRQLLDNVQTQLDQALAEQERLETVLEEHEGHRQQLVDKLAADRADAARALAAATLEQEQTLKALADHRIELQSLQENARHLESLAAAGRAALEVGRELQGIVAAVDARARSLLVQSTREAADRQQIEALRGDAIRAASLARQITQVNAETVARLAIQPDVAISAVDRSKGPGRNM